MKSKRIIDSWNKIEPDSAADARMLTAIINHNQARTAKIGKSFSEREIVNWRLLAPIAACLIIAVTIAAVYMSNSGWFGNRVLTVGLDGGGTISFYMDNVPGAGSLSFDTDVLSRDLTAEETRAFFGDLPVTSHGIFDANNGELLHIEGKNDNIKVILTTSGSSVSDEVIDAPRFTSVSNDIPVSAGYFITNDNSRSARNIIYIASFELGGFSVHIECWGDLGNSEALGRETASTIESIIQNKEIELRYCSDSIMLNEYYYYIPLEECELIPESVRIVTDVYEFETGIDSLVRREIIEDGFLFLNNSVTRIMWGNYMDDDPRGFLAVIKRDADGVMTGMVYRVPAYTP